MEQITKPWERPIIKNVITVLNGTVVKVDTITKQVGGKDEKDLHR